MQKEISALAPPTMKINHRSTGEEILRLDRRIHLGFPLHLPTDVDLEARIRRVWPIHRPPKVLLSCDLLGTCLGESEFSSRACFSRTVFWTWTVNECVCFALHDTFGCHKQLIVNSIHVMFAYFCNIGIIKGKIKYGINLQ